MLETNIDDISVDDIMQKIREEVAKEKDDRVQSSQPAQKSASMNQPQLPFPWRQISASLGVAEHFCEVGTANSVMQNYPKAVRWLALLVGRVVLHLTQPISFPQRKFNQAVLQALRVMLDGTCESQQVTARRLDGVHELKQVIERQLDVIVALESRIQTLEDGQKGR